MAFTEKNKSDAYLFFTLVFNAAPGKVFGGQIVEAYKAGMDTAQIVAQYVTKPDFLKLYPATQTNTEFATAFVNNVIGTTATEVVKAAAVKDITGALAAGWSKDKVIVQILSNLNSKTVADKEYGKTVQMLTNKIAVAKELTEGAKALDTTDVNTLQTPLKGVTDDVATVQAALNGAGDLAAKLDALTAVKKELTNFITVNKLGDAVKDVAAAEAAVKALATTAGAAIKADGLSADAGVKAAEIQTAQATAQLNIKTTAKSVSDIETALSKIKSTDGKATLLDALKNKTAADQASTAATNTLKAGGIAVDKALADAVTLGSSATLSATGTAAGATAPTKAGAAAATVKALVVNDSGSAVISFNTTTKVFEFAAAATNAQKTVLATTLASLNTLVGQADAADKAAGVALDAAPTGVATATVPAPANEFLNGDFTGAFTGVALKNETGAAVVNPKDVATAVTTYAAVLKSVKTATDTNEKLVKDIAVVNANSVLLADLKAIGEKLTAAEKSFTDAGFKLPVEVKGALFATADSDIYLATANSDAGSIFGFAGKDSVYVGKGYVLGADVAKGNDAALEIFFKANNGSTDVYVEQKAFGSSSAANTKDIVKITLTGVAADKLVLKDGFVQIAA